MVACTYVSNRDEQRVPIALMNVSAPCINSEKFNCGSILNKLIGLKEVTYGVFLGTLMLLGGLG